MEDFGAYVETDNCNFLLVAIILPDGYIPECTEEVCRLLSGADNQSDTFFWVFGLGNDGNFGARGRGLKDWVFK